MSTTPFKSCAIRPWPGVNPASRAKAAIRASRREVTLCSLSPGPYHACYLENYSVSSGFHAPTQVLHSQRHRGDPRYIQNSLSTGIAETTAGARYAERHLPLLRL